MKIKMKDSGEAWLGNVPAHWAVVPAAAIFRESKERARDGDQMLSSTQKYGVIPLADFEEMEQRQVTKASVNLEMRKHVEVGDFVISMRSMDGGLERAKAVGSVRSSYSVLKASQDVDGRYFGVLLKSSLYIQALRLTSNFIRDGQDLSFTHVKKVRLPKPSLIEQATIADYLDHATARIDTLVAKKTRFIELLREKRQALITHAVTKGLDPSVPMKDSGVEWLGKVPARWAITKCGRFLSILSGYAFPSSGFDPDGDGTRLLRGVNVGVGRLRWDDVVYWKRTPCDGLDDYEMRVGDLVIGMDRPQITGGIRVAHVTEVDVPCLLLQRVASLRTSDALSSEFLFYYLSTHMFVAHFSPDTTGISVPHISPEQIASFVISVPPLEDQGRIVDHIREKTSRIDSLIAKTERSIELLSEHRTALITAAVTGKIDLREPA